MQLNKYLAHCGVCSRRKAVELIKQGLVTVNNQVVNNPAYRVQTNDRVMCQAQVVAPEDFVYVLLNKPAGYLTTVKDFKGRKTVLDLIDNVACERLYPVGRLDKETTGLLLLTNDGELAYKLSHPKFMVEKKYVVTLDRPFEKNDFVRLSNGISLEDGPIKPDNVVMMADDIVGVVLHSGKNRIVRRMFCHLGYVVEKLDRVEFAGLVIGKLSRAGWRFLSSSEITALKKLC